eukprot:201662_1
MSYPSGIELQENPNEDKSSTWITNAIAFMVAASCVCSVYIYAIYTMHLSRRRKKNSATSTGTVIDRTHYESYTIKYQFDDRRVEITERFLPRLFHKFLFYPDSDECPVDIINICVQYLGMDTFAFWYGPFSAQTKVAEREWYRYRIGAGIGIQYDATNPHNCDNYIENPSVHANDCVENTIFYFCVMWGNVAITIMTVFMVYHLIQSEHVKSDNVGSVLVLCILSPLCIALAIVSYLLCWKRRTCCFKSNLERSFNVSKAEEMQDDTRISISVNDDQIASENTSLLWKEPLSG